MHMLNQIKDGVVSESDITLEFAEWAKRNNLVITESNYYNLWESFLEAEYNEQRKWEV